MIALSNELFNPLDARIIGCTVLYFCQSNFKLFFYKKMIEYVENLIPIRPYVLFTMSNHVGPEVNRYASLQSCCVSHDHRLIDKFYFLKIKQNWLTRRTDTSFSGDLCGIKPGRLQRKATMSIEVKVRTGNCTTVMVEKTEPYLSMASLDFRLLNSYSRMYQSTLRECAYCLFDKCVNHWLSLSLLSGRS